MIKITLDDGREYTAASGWEDITLEQFIQVCDIEIPKKQRELLIAAAALNDPDEKKLEEAEKEYDRIAAKIFTRDLIKTFPTYYP